MKKLLISIGLTLLILTLTACTDKTSFQEIDNVEDNTPKDQIITNNIPEELNHESEESNNTYTIHHEKDDTIYTVTLTKDIDSNYTMQLFDEESNLLQQISFGRIPEGIDVMDVNLDGYTDIVANTGGTVNETHELYTWDVSTQNYMKVIFEGFEMLSFFEVYDGYIENFIRGGSPEDSVMEKLIWEGNTLIKV